MLCEVQGDAGQCAEMHEACVGSMRQGCVIGGGCEALRGDAWRWRSCKAELRGCEAAASCYGSSIHRVQGNVISGSVRRVEIRHAAGTLCRVWGATCLGCEGPTSMGPCDASKFLVQNLERSLTNIHQCPKD